MGVCGCVYLYTYSRTYVHTFQTDTTLDAVWPMWWFVTDVALYIGLAKRGCDRDQMLTFCSATETRCDFVQWQRPDVNISFSNRNCLRETFNMMSEEDKSLLEKLRPQLVESIGIEAGDLLSQLRSRGALTAYQDDEIRVIKSMTLYPS